MNADKPPIEQAVAGFFDAFVTAFSRFDGSEIAQRYLVPYAALHADGVIDCLASASAVADYFQTVLDDYHAQGCRSCRYKDLAVLALGGQSALGTVTWELLRADGSVLGSWRESYHLARVGEGWRVFATVDHVA